MKFLSIPFLAIAAGADASAADIVIPHDPTVPTTVGRTHSIGPWIDGSAIAPCAAGGDRPAKALDMAAMAVAKQYWLGNPKLKSDVAAAAKAAIDAGSQDPMVHYVYARCADIPASQQVELLAQNDKRFAGSAYPGARWFLNDWYWYDTLAHATPVDQAALAAAGAALVDHGITTLATTPDADGAEIVTAELYLKMVTTLDGGPGVADRWLAELAKPEIPPWWRGLLAGRIHIDLGWQSRGHGWGNTVTEAGWKGMTDQLALAREQLTAAWKLHPDRPEPATQMIEVALNSSGGAGEDCATWFNRAVAVQMDDPVAFEAMWNPLQPRWGGSYPQMLALGQAGLDTGRYDSKAPWMYISAVFHIDFDAHMMKTDAHDVLNAKVYQQCVAIIAAYGRYQARTDPTWDATCLACVAFMCGQYQDCLNQLDAAGPTPSQFWLGQIYTTAEGLRANARAMLPKGGGAPPAPATHARPGFGDL